MIIDAFMYYNELDALKIRLGVLSPYVDKFVLVESNKTFTGADKPLYSEQFGDWIEPFRDKIKLCLVEFPDRLKTPWEREAYQRNAILDFLPSRGYGDTIFLSDADEIPNLGALGWEINTPVQLDVTQYFWRLNWRVPDHCNQGGRPLMFNGADSIIPQEDRSSSRITRVPNAGWHFSFLNADQLGKQKIEAFSHTEYDLPEYKEKRNIARRMREGIDPFDRFPLRRVPIDESYPKWIRDNVKELCHLVQPELGRYA